MSNPAMKPTKPRIWYLCVWPKRFYLSRYFSDEHSAKRCVQHIRESYNITGSVVKVQEVR